MSQHKDVLLEIAKNTSFSEFGLHFKANSPAAGKKLLCTYEETFALWASIMGRDFMAIEFGNSEIRVPASIGEKVQTSKINEMIQTQSSSNLLWFANVAVSPALLALAHDLMENPRKAGVVRISDELQVIMSDSCSGLAPGHTMKEATSWKRSQFWYPEDLIDFHRECQQALTPDGSNYIEYTWRGYDPTIGMNKGKQSKWLKFTTRYRLFDGGDGDFYQLSENLGMEELIQIPV